MIYPVQLCADPRLMWMVGVHDSGLGPFFSSLNVATSQGTLAGALLDSSDVVGAAEAASKVQLGETDSGRRWVEGWSMSPISM